MRESCNVKNFSYFSASLQIAFGIYVIVAVTYAGFKTPTGDDPEALKSAQIFLAVILAFGLVSLALLVTLVVGLKENRISLIKIYVYASLVLLVFNVLEIVASFVLGFVNLLPLAEVFCNLLRDLWHMVLFVAILLPIIMHYRRMQAARGRTFHKTQYDA